MNRFTHILINLFINLFIPIGLVIGLVIGLGLATNLGAQGLSMPADSIKKTKVENTKVEKTQIEIINVNKLKAVDSLQFKKLIGEVALQQDDVIFHCDSAYLYEADNSIDAFGQVHIQQGDSIDIFADYLEYDGSTKFARLFQNVELNDSKTIIHSDTLYYYVEDRRALLFTGVDISDQKITIVADSVEYLSLQDKAYFYDNAALTDGDMYVTADKMDYDFRANVGTYEGNGEMTSNNSLLKSDKGWYDANTNDVRFEDNVYVEDSTYEIDTDRLLYNLDSKKAIFNGPTTIVSEGSEIQSSSGFYDQENDIISLKGESTLNDGPQFLKADSLYFEQETGWGFAFGNVFWEDTSQQIILECNALRYNQDSSAIVAFDNLVFQQVIDSDTLFLIADTLETQTRSSVKQDSTQENSVQKDSTQENSIQKDSTQENSSLYLAYPNVKLYKSDFQGVCDSLSYQSLDSVFRMYMNPIVWFDSTQLNADTIFLTTENQDPSEIQLKRNAWIVNENQLGIYNQLKGNNINGLFNNGDLSDIIIKQNAESIYFAQDSAKAYIGVNKASCPDMKILFEESEIQRIKFLGESVSKFEPMQKIDPFSYRLDGFRWQNGLRPPRSIFVKNNKILTIEKKPEIKEEIEEVLEEKTVEKGESN